jgi:hypothetical protein
MRPHDQDRLADLITMIAIGVLIGGLVLLLSR